MFTDVPEIKITIKTLALLCPVLSAFEWFTTNFTYLVTVRGECTEQNGHSWMLSDERQKNFNWAYCGFFNGAISSNSLKIT
jgi:hypothetical protein